MERAGPPDMKQERKRETSLEAVQSLIQPETNRKFSLSL